MSKIIYLLFCFLFLNTALAQDFSGQWSGELAQDGKTDTYNYSIEFTQTGDEINGTATSQPTKGGTVSKFEIGGVWDGNNLTLQEVQQLEPPNGRSCLKHVRLQIIEKQGIAHLEGRWVAEGCTPGSLSLKNEKFPTEKIPAPKSSLPELSGQAIPHPSSLNGRWSGTLSQSDRDYGFYFEMELSADGTGTSHIQSDGEGGNATMQLRWTFDEAAGRFDFEETAITEESVPSWRWCMKSGSLFFQKEKNRRSLVGDWEGFIEGYTQESGPCAPGKLYLEKPILENFETPVPLKSTDKQAVSTNTKPAGISKYEKNQGRNVEVERVIEVTQKQIKIRVWDNGTIDGDVLSLFLNGEMLLKNYRVTRNKHEILVTLNEPTNFLVLHAISLGSISPNTVAVSVDDGTGEKVVMVSSTLKTSGAVMIKEFMVGE